MQAHALSGRVSKQHTGVSDETVADTEVKCGRNRKCALEPSDALPTNANLTFNQIIVAQR